MNIFVLADDPYEAARHHCDRHVVKMVVESAQLLSTAHRLLDGHEAERRMPKSSKKKKVWALPDWRDIILYDAIHNNHPCALWCRESSQNYMWLWRLLDGLCDEYYFRYGEHKKAPRHHSVKLSGLLGQLRYLPHSIPQTTMTDFAVVMPEHLRLATAMDSYRNYYIQNKASLLAYTHRSIPSWIPASAGARQLP